MTQSQINCFLSVACSGSFTKAAEELYISQPAVSKQVSQLEGELKLELFDRTQKRIHLTEAGRKLKKFFESSKEGFESLISELRDAKNDIDGEVRVGCLEGWSISDFYPSFREYFSRTYPKIKIILVAYLSNNSVGALRSGEIDAMIMHDKILQGKKGLQSCRLAEIQDLLLYSKNHHLADKEGLTLSDFRDESFYVIARESLKVFRGSIDMCISCGFDPKIIILPNLSSILLNIQAGAGVMLADMWFRERINPVYKYLTLGSKHMVSVGWVDGNRNPAKKLFVDELISWYTDGRNNTQAEAESGVFELN